MEHLVDPETMLTSRMVQIPNRRGYTLIEMMVIVTVMSIFSYMVMTNYVGLRDGQQRRALYPAIADLVSTARNMAITNTSTTYLMIDSTANALVLKEEQDASTYQNQSGGSSSGSTIVVNGHVQSTRTNTNIGTSSLDHSNDKTLKTVPLIAGLQFGNLQLAGSSSDSGSWKLHFYADGSSDGGGIEISDRSQSKSIVINTHGGVQQTDGTLPDTSQDRWTAGDYVHRQ